MKQGPKEAPAAPIGSLSPLLLRYMANYLPTYHLFGPKSVLRVCKAWGQAFNKDFLKGKINQKQLINTCYTSEDALNIISDPAVCKQLSFEDMLGVAGKYPPLTEFILNRYQDLISFQGLLRLGKHNITSAQIILNTPFLKTLFYQDPNPDLEMTVYFGNYHPSIAWQLLEETSDNLSKHHLVSLGKASIDVARHIIKEKTLCQKLSLSDFAGLLHTHPPLIEEFFHCDKILKSDNTLNEEKIFFPNKVILNNEFDMWRLLAILGRIHFGIAERLLKIPSIKADREQAFDLHIAFSKHSKIAWNILTEFNDLLTEDTLRSLGCYHIDIAWHILKTPTMANQLTVLSLQELGFYHHEIAWHILNTKDLKEKLLGKKSHPCLAYLAYLHPDIIRHILDTPDLYENVTAHSEGLNILVQWHLESAERVRSPSFAKKIDACNQIIEKARSLLQEEKIKKLNYKLI